MKRLLLILWVTLHWCLAWSVAAQPPHVAFKHLTIDNGLSQNAVFAILQDRHGLMWFGTKDGLNRYDGYSFVVYQNNPFDSTSLSGSYVTALFEDSRGTLWVGTFAGGLNRFHPETESFQHVKYESSRSDNSGMSAVTAIVEDFDHNLWVGTSGDGLFRITIDDLEVSGATASTQFVHKPGVPGSLSDNTVHALLIDAKGILWVGTGKKLDKLVGKKDGDRFEHFTLFTKNPRAPAGPNDNSVTAIYADSMGVLWLGTASGVCRFDRERGSYIHYPHHYEIFRYGWGVVTGILEDDTGKLWLATPGELMRFDPEDQSYAYFRHDPQNSHSISYNGVSSLCRDRADVLWFGTPGAGIDRYDPKALRFATLVRSETTPSRIAGFSVRSILEDNTGQLWVSTDVLYRWHRQTGELESFETSSNRPDDFGNTGAWSMRQASSADLWFATSRGLYRTTPAIDKIRQYKFDPADTSGLRQKEVCAVFEDRGGQIWIATESYLSELVDAERGRFRHFRYQLMPPQNEAVRPVIYQDNKNRMWLGTKDGLLRFDSASGAFFAYRNDPARPTSLSNNLIKAICPDPEQPDQFLWLGTGGGGLDRFAVETGIFTHFTQKQGLPNNVVYGILPDDRGNLWLSTNKGLARFAPNTGLFRNYDVRDGLQSNEFNTGAAYRSHRGELFFGGIKGLNYFRPEAIKDNPNVPGIVLTGVKVLDRASSQNATASAWQTAQTDKDHLTLSYRDNVITFEFAALDYSAPEKNQYAYRMENFNEGWIYVGSVHTATYTNLPPGKYIFHVKGSNNDGVWNETGVALHLTITPPWWKTWWAYAIYLLTFAGLLLAVRRYELNRLQLKNRLRIEHVKAEKLREVDQMKSRFFANISHEFRTPLTLILGQIDSVLVATAEKENQSKLEVASRNARRLQRLINQLLDLSKLEAGSMALKATRANVVSFLKNLVASFEHLAEQKQITLQFHSTHDEIHIDFDPEKLEKVFYNLLSNAFKFTPEGGMISVQLSENQLFTDHWLLITVSDTGIGISDEHLPHVFDRFYQADSTHLTEGTGIGLALAKELVELHGGEISVKSVVGVGTEFVVKLPLVSVASEQFSVISNQVSGKLQVASEQEAFAPSIQQASDRSIQPSSQEIVLLVEDNSDIQAYVCAQLQDKYRVVSAGDGEEGLAQAREAIPDLIITDVMMPKMDGYEMSRVLKHDEKTSHIPIIMLTAKAALDDKIAGLETGADDYLLKPFSARELLARVRNLISQRRELRRRFSTATIIKPSEVAVTSVDQAFLQRVITAIETHISDEHFGVEELARAVSMSSSQINRKLHGLIDQPASQLVRSMRLQRAADLLKQNAGTVAEICYQVGFSDQANFTRAFKKQFGMAPGEFRSKSG